MGLRQNLRVVTGALLPACGLQFAHASSDLRTIVSDVTPGPYGDMVKQTIAPALKERGCRVVVRELSDYVQPNMALSNGSVDANLFQHSLYFDKLTADRDLKLSKLVMVPTAGMGFYSHEIRNLDELKKGDMITLSNDPTNLARSPRSLQSIGPITTEDSIDPTKASEHDITSNPRELAFKPLEAAQLPRTLDGVTSALVNGNFAVTAKTDLVSTIKQEHLDENLKSIITVHSEDAGRPFAKDIVETVKSPAYRAVINDPQNICSAFQKPEWMSTAQQSLHTRVNRGSDDCPFRISEMTMIEIERVCVDFSAGRGPSTQAVNGVSLRISAGEIFGIVGTSGAGKSMLLRALNALTRPSQESVKANGVEISALEGGRLRKAHQRIDMIFQHFNLMHIHTVTQSVAFSLKAAGWGRSKIGPHVSEILALMGLSDKADRFPVQLSGGQKQRMDITRTTTSHPDVLLCDEPTSALDLETSATILALLKQINQQLGITIVLITYKMTMIKSVCDRVAVMSGDKVVESGEMFDIFTHPQHAFAQQLVSHTLNLTLPERLRQHPPDQLLKTPFIGDSAEQPVLSEVAVKFDVAVNTLHGKIEYIDERALGILVVQLTAPHSSSAVEVTVKHIRQRIAQVEVIRGWFIV